MKLYYDDPNDFIPYMKPIEIRDSLYTTRYKVMRDPSLKNLHYVLHLTDASGMKLATAKQKRLVLSTVPKFYLEINGRERRTELYYQKGEPFCTVSEPEWKIDGDPFLRLYDIMEGEQIAASVQKSFTSKGSSIEIIIPDDQDEAEVLAAFMAIEACVNTYDAD